MKKPVIATQNEKAKLFQGLHHSGKLLVLPNIWDPLGAILLEHLGFPAVATASASIAYANGYADGEHISFKKMRSISKSIVNSVSVPVTVDMEAGYAVDDSLLEKNIRSLLKLGIAGINIEDTDKRRNKLMPVKEQAKRITLIKKTAAKMDCELFVNARTDVYIHQEKGASVSKLTDDAIRRGVAYNKAGADGFYPITLTDENEIRKIVGEIELPINILAIRGIPAFETLSEIGVERVSLGPGFLKASIQSLRNLALHLKEEQGLDEIIANNITSDFLKQLVNRES